MNDKVSNRLKEKWKEIIKKKIRTWNDKGIKSPDWEKELDEVDTYQKLNQLGLQLIKEIASNTYLAASNLNHYESNPLLEKTAEILDKYRIEKELDENKNDALNKTVKVIEDKLKTIVGNDLNNWETKIVKTDSNNKDIADLQNKVSQLTTEKDNLDKEVKQKQQQIIDHKCDSPNNAELNQIKEDLKKANQEKEQLQTELNKKDPGTPLPIPQQKEEDKKEEQENLTLTVEGLRAKLNSKQKEIRNLQEHLAQVKQKKEPEAKFLSGMAVGFLIMAGIGGITYFIRFYQKKKKNSEIINFLKKIAKIKLLWQQRKIWKIN